MGKPTNPFSTRFVHPGKIPFAFPDCPRKFTQASYTCQDQRECRLRQLAVRLNELPSGRAAIVGPHGSGKSTLIHSLVPHLGSVAQFATPIQARPVDREIGHVTIRDESDQVTIYWYQFQAGSNVRRVFLRDSSHWLPYSLLILDGFEQLGVFHRLQLALWRKVRKLKLLVTLHQRSRSFVTLFETAPNREILHLVIDTLCEKEPQVAQEAKKLLNQYALTSNIRDALFDLYDWYEQRAER